MFSTGYYDAWEVQNKITKCETFLQTLRQIYILDKRKLHKQNTFIKDMTNLQVAFTSAETNRIDLIGRHGVLQIQTRESIKSIRIASNFTKQLQRTMLLTLPLNKKVYLCLVRHLE